MVLMALWLTTITQTRLTWSNYSLIRLLSQRTSSSNLFGKWDSLQIILSQCCCCLAECMFLMDSSNQRKVILLVKLLSPINSVMSFKILILFLYLISLLDLSSEGILRDSCEEVRGAARQRTHSHFSFRNPVRQCDWNPWNSSRLQELQECTSKTPRFFSYFEIFLLWLLILIQFLFSPQGSIPDGIILIPAKYLGRNTALS